MYSPSSAARICLFAASTILAVPGCSTQSQRIGYDDGSDVCRQQRVALDSTGDFFGEDIVKGVAAGAVVGGLTGLVAGGNARSALIGAAAGAAVGGAGGYWAARIKQQQNQASLYSSVYSDIERDNAQIDKTQLAFNQLVDCRQNEANRIKTAYRSGQLQRPQAEAAMADVRTRAAQDIQIARQTSGKIQDRSANFEFANNQVNPNGSSYRTSSAAPTRTGRRPAARPAATPAPGSAAAVQVATSTNVAKRDQFNASIVSAQNRQSGFELG